MNIQESIKFLESKGHKVYPKGKNSYSVWSPGQKNASVDCRYTERELIKFARSRGQHRPMGHKNYPVGPGGPNCPCCAPPMEDLKRFTKRRNRRNWKKDIEN